MTSKARPERYVYLDFLRALACFFVIVNHTNSDVFQAAAPGGFTWFCSVTWYYLSKTAIPLFVMVSGACLLPKTDSYRRCFQRFLRMLLALVVFSYAYYLYGLVSSEESMAGALNLSRFFAGIWARRITDSFWYLYFYLGLLLMLPLLQRLAKAMKKKDCLYLLGLSLGLNAFWPLLVHYVPGLAMPEYFNVPLANIFIGLFFAGHYLQAYASPTRTQITLCCVTVPLSVLAATLLTLLETGRVAPGEKYWFMDERTAPAMPVILCAIAIMLLARGFFEGRKAGTERDSTVAFRLLTAMGSCSFGVFLLQDMMIDFTYYRFFIPLWNVMNPFPAAILWEVMIFAVLMPVVWLLKKIPGMSRLL